MIYMDAIQYIHLFDSLMSDMRSHAGGWAELRKRIMPRTEANANLEEDSSHSPVPYTFSSTAHASLLTLASAHLTYITPMDQRWFSFKSKLTGKKSSNKTDDWFCAATETTYQALAGSNFYTTMHEVYIDRCLTGTGCMLAEISNDGILYFKHIPTGTYAIGEGPNGCVDTLVREFKFTAHQAAKSFGLKNLPKKIQEAYEDQKKRYLDKFDFIHIVTPRDSYAFGSSYLSPEERRWSDVYIAKNEQYIVQNDGFYEFPFLVTRFLKFGDQPYGEAPGSVVMPEIKGSLFLERIIDTLASVAAFPRTAVLAEQVGEIDLRAGGMTVISPEAAQLGLPREFMTGGRFDIGLERLEAKKSEIKRAYYVDMLHVISQVERPMTATEVNAREAEKVLGFTPSFTLFISDFRIMMQRIFALLYRANFFNAEGVPPEIITTSADGKNNEIAIPQIRYLGKISQAIERIQRYGIEGALDLIIRYTQGTGDTTMMEALKAFEILRFLWEASGAPIKCIMTEDEFKDMLEKKDKLATLQQEMLLMQEQAKANKDNAQARAIAELII